MKKLIILTIQNEIVSSLAGQIAKMHSDEHVSIKHINLDNLETVNNVLKNIDGVIVTSLNWHMYMFNKNSPGHFMINQLKDMNYPGKLIVSVDNDVICSECINSVQWHNDVLFVESLYWHKMEQIKNFILT